MRASGTAASAATSTPTRTAAVTVLGAMLSLSCAAPAAPETPLFDFVAMLPFAALQQETGVIDFGTVAGRQTLIDGWSGVDQSAGEVNFVWGLGFESSLGFTVIEPRPRSVVVRGRPFAPEAQGAEPRWSVRVAVNGVAVSEAVFTAIDQEHRFEVPAAALRAGDNVLTFGYALDPTADSLADLVGPRDERSRAIAWDRLTLLDSHPGGVVEVSDGDALDVPLMNRLDYFAAPAAPATLFIEAVRPWGAAPDGAALQIEIQADGEPGPRRHFVRLPTSEPVEIDLGAADHTPLRISFLPIGRSESGAAGLTLVRPRLGRSPSAAGAVPADAVPADAVPAGAVPADFVRQPNVIIYLIDALRADRLGTYGYHRPVSPRIDAFAADAVVFENAIANAPWTRSAVASLFTGLYPRSHGVLGRDDALPAEAVTLASLLRDAGYYTASFCTNGNVSPSFGFDVGFETWRQFPEQQTEAIHQYSDVVNEATFEWLDGEASRSPFFLYVHTTDPHEPYTPPSPFRERFAQPTEHGLFRPIYERADAALAQNPGLTLEQITADLSDLYDAEIAFNDAEFGRLIDKLVELDLYDDSLIILVADHGEAFWEHGKWAHGTSLYFEQIDVPLIVKFPGRWGAGARSTILTQQIDLLPTVLETLGIDGPEAAQGRSLLAAVDDPAREIHDWVLAELDMEGRRMDALRTPELKLIRYFPAVYHGRKVELFDLGADRTEQIDIGDRLTASAGYLLAQLNVEASNHLRLLAAARGTPDAETLERLRALGYIR